MSRLVDIKSEKFWDVLFDEACVEGSQAERIENDLNKIAVSEQEIRNKAIDEFAEKLCNESCEQAMTVVLENKIRADILTLDGVTELAWEIAEQMKGGE